MAFLIGSGCFHINAAVLLSKAKKKVIGLHDRYNVPII